MIPSGGGGTGGYVCMWSALYTTFETIMDILVGDVSRIVHVAILTVAIARVNKDVSQKNKQPANNYKNIHTTPSINSLKGERPIRLGLHIN